MPRGKRATAPTENDDTDAGLPVRSRLAAGSIPPPATTGAASVFALANMQPKPRRKKAPSIDPDAIAIERGVAVPPPKPKRSPYLTLLQRMRPGDMVRITAKQAWSMKSAAKAHGPGPSSRAVVGPLEPSVGRLLDEGTNTSGPRGTYGCACAHHDGSMCAWIRYGGDGPEDPCECLCHGWPEDEDDYLG